MPAEKGGGQGKTVITASFATLSDKKVMADCDVEEPNAHIFLKSKIESQEEVFKSGLPCLVDFWAPWCGHCRIVGPIVEEIAKEYQGKLKAGKLNVDEAPKTASRHEVISIPTLSIFKGGERIETVVGALPKEQIEEKIKPHIT